MTSLTLPGPVAVAARDVGPQYACRDIHGEHICARHCTRPRAKCKAQDKHASDNAHGFAKYINCTNLVLGDVLSRSLTQLSTTTEKDAEHAGWRMLTARDVVEAFGELGTRAEELKENCAVHSAKRVEDLADMRGAFLSVTTVGVFLCTMASPTRPGPLSRR